MLIVECQALGTVYSCTSVSQLAWLLCQRTKDPGKPGGALGMVDGFSQPRHEKQKPKVGQTAN